MTAAWRCERGSTLLIPSGPKSGQMHLFALMLNPLVVDGHGERPQVLLVCVTSVPKGLHDTACLLSAGEHPFVVHDSYVDYRFTRLEPVERIERCVLAGSFMPREVCSETLRIRILRGALVSRRISREYRQLIEAALFAD